jgi:hypothetical protein
MSPEFWNRRGDRLVALIGGLERRLIADGAKWEEALGRSLDSIFSGDPEPYRETIELADRMKETRQRLRRAWVLMDQRLASAVLEVYYPEGPPS